VSTTAAGCPTSAVELGRAALDGFVHSGLVERRDGSRVLTITAAGAKRLPTLLPGFDTGAGRDAAAEV
jgi:hypothetical protein